ncbi:hypothetical protein AB0L64_03155 [Kribbella sp. NPDC051936]|uniref:nucleotidyltransferase domain-containing protein n=1 Tax=Kribbella sp. NPDC051936 TaxID=3154946 RepID=UPI003429AB21
MARTNDLAFVRDAVGRLEGAGVRTWLFGGWASELLGLSLPRAHQDLDLLYPADNFEAVDGYLESGDVREIVAKRLPHKRAFEVDGIRVELFLVQPGPYTDFWGATRHTWPANVFDVEAGGFRVASAMALLEFRDAWEKLRPVVGGRTVTAEEWLANQVTR